MEQNHLIVYLVIAHFAPHEGEHHGNRAPAMAASAGARCDSGGRDSGHPASRPARYTAQGGPRRFSQAAHEAGHRMPINVNDFANADSAFRAQIKAELQRATETLNLIAALFQAGFAEPQVLKEFREAVDRVREAGWIAQQALDSAESQQTTEMLFAHRARAAISLLKHLRLELEHINLPSSTTLLQDLLKAGSAFHEAAIARGAVDGHKE